MLKLQQISDLLPNGGSEGDCLHPMHPIGHRSCEKINNMLGEFCVLSDWKKRLLARSLLIF